MDREKRREFLRNSLKFGAVAGVSLVGAKALVAEEATNEKNVLVGKSKKQEKLYEQSESWKSYYNIAH